MRWALLCAFALSACTDFTALEADVCARRPWLCVEDAGAYCRPCAKSEECGAATFCFAGNPGAHCGLDCSTEGCPYGAVCTAVMNPDGGGQIGKNCLPVDCGD